MVEHAAGTPFHQGSKSGAEIDLQEATEHAVDQAVEQAVVSSVEQTVEQETEETTENAVEQHILTLANAYEYGGGRGVDLG